jgi:regulator of sigma D
MPYEEGRAECPWRQLTTDFCTDEQALMCQELFPELKDFTLKEMHYADSCPCHAIGYDNVCSELYQQFKLYGFEHEINPTEGS